MQIMSIGKRSRLRGWVVNLRSRPSVGSLKATGAFGLKGGQEGMREQGASVATSLTFSAEKYPHIPALVCGAGVPYF